MSDSKRVTSDTKTERAIAKASKSQRVRHSAKRDRDEAFRVRAGAIGLLQCCLCDYPLRQHATATFHDESCPAHAMGLSALAAGAHYALTFTKSSKEP